MSFKSHLINSNIEVFFGDKNFSFNKTPQHCQLKQVHSNLVVPASQDNTHEADAHYTTESNLYLCISTADCMPIMLTDGLTIAAVHAGWKGLFTGILTNVIKTCFPSPEKTEAYIGPHIHQQSFEFGKDTLNNFNNYLPLKNCENAVLSSSKEKVHINLKLLAEYELKDQGVNKVESLNIDTFSSFDHHSYRRDHKNSGRNISWIVIKN